MPVYYVISKDYFHVYLCCCLQTLRGSLPTFTSVPLDAPIVEAAVDTMAARRKTCAPNRLLNTTFTTKTNEEAALASHFSSTSTEPMLLRTSLSPQAAASAPCLVDWIRAIYLSELTPKRQLDFLDELVNYLVDLKNQVVEASVFSAAPQTPAPASMTSCHRPAADIEPRATIARDTPLNLSTVRSEVELGVLNLVRQHDVFCYLK